MAWLLASDAAAGEDDLVRLRADQRRDLPARDLDRVVRRLAVRVRTRRVPPQFAKRMAHRVRHRGIHRRRRVVVEVDRIHTVGIQSGTLRRMLHARSRGGTGRGSRHARPLAPAMTPLSPAVLGRVLADDARADADSPPFDKSLRDGYAVRAADCAKPECGTSRRRRDRGRGGADTDRSAPASVPASSPAHRCPTAPTRS